MPHHVVVIITVEWPKPAVKLNAGLVGDWVTSRASALTQVNNLKEVVKYSEKEVKEEKDTTNKGEDSNYAPVTNPTHKPPTTTQETATPPTATPVLPTTKPDSDYSRKLLVVRGKMLGKSVWVLIDGGSQGNFKQPAGMCCACMHNP